MDELVYKIRDKKSGLYSVGGTYISFTEKGKIWIGKQNLMRHLGLFELDYYKKYNRYQNCEVVAFAMVEKEIIPIKDLTKELKAKRKK